MGAFVNLRIQGTVYFTSCRNGNINRMARMFSSRLVGGSHESTFTMLYSLFDGKWHQQYDVVHPFHEHQRDDDSRNALIASVWTFDIDNDTVHIDAQDFCGQLSLERVRQGPFQKADISPCMAKALLTDAPQAALPALLPQYTQLTRPNLNLSLLKRRKALLGKLLQDFAFQWRHVLRGPYNDSTVRRLAYAVIRILTLDFTVEEIDTPRRASSGHLVRLQDLPGWKVCDEDVVRVGGVSIVICQHLLHALNLAKGDFQRWTAGRTNHASDDFRTYLLFSRHHASLYQIRNGIERYTRPECLMDSTSNFTPAAIGLLFEATQQPVLEHLNQRVSTEIQDMILENAAIGPIKRAQLGCILNTGSIFQWQSNGRKIEREQADRHRVNGTPVESRIYFDNCFSGLAYK
ncbi:hypothetical protein M3J09_007983 [Ascochyta lentis]